MDPVRDGAWGAPDRARAMASTDRPAASSLSSHARSMNTNTSSCAGRNGDALAFVAMDLHPGEEIVFEGHPSWRATLLFYVWGVVSWPSCRSSSR